MSREQGRLSTQQLLSQNVQFQWRRACKAYDSASRLISYLTGADDGQWRHIVMQRVGARLEFWVNGVRNACNTATGNDISMACDYPWLKTGGKDATGHCDCAIARRIA